MTFQKALIEGTKILQEKGISDAKIDAWYLLSHVTKMNRSEFILKSGEVISDDDLKSYEELIELRSNHFPLQQIIKEQNFMGFDFYVDENVLIPRQDTETLVEEALKLIDRGSRVLDLCTGSGCIIISLAKLCEGIDATGIDVSDKALEVAKKNGANLAPCVDFFKSDLFENVLGKYNLIVSNPPYIRTSEIEVLEAEVREHEPRIALDGFEDGLYFYRKIVHEAPEHLLDDGFLIFEIGFDQGEDVKNIMEECGFMDVAVIKDLAGHDRIVRGHM